MTPTELKQAMHTLYGTSFGAQRRLAADTGYHEVMISRYMNGTHKISSRFAKSVDNLVRARTTKMKRNQTVENLL